MQKIWHSNNVSQQKNTIREIKPLIARHEVTNSMHSKRFGKKANYGHHKLAKASTILTEQKHRNER